MTELRRAKATCLRAWSTGRMPVRPVAFVAAAATRPHLLRAEGEVADPPRLTVRLANGYLEDDGSPPTKRRGIIGNTVRKTQLGTKTVAAPATVSGLPFILVAPRRHATARRAGRQMNGAYP